MAASTGGGPAGCNLCYSGGSVVVEDNMRKWEYCTLEYKVLTKESKSSSRKMTRIAKAKIHYFEDREVRTKRLFKYIYPKKSDLIEKAISRLGSDGRELVESKSEEFDSWEITRYQFKRPLAD